MPNYKQLISRIFFCFVLITLGALYPISAESFEPENDSVPPKTSQLASKPWTVSRYSVRLGFFAAISTTNLGVGINGRKPVSYSLENVFDMNRNTFSGMLNFNLRFGKHNRLDFSYYNLYRASTATLKKDVQFGEHEYPLNSTVKAHLNTNVLRISYGYSFFSNPQWEVGALAGFHAMLFNTGLNLHGNTIDESFKDNANFVAPLPDFGLWGTYAFADCWALSTELSYFYLTYKNFYGRILNAQLTLQYKLSRHWQIDLGYTDFDVRVGLNRKHLEADFNWNYHGPFLTGVYKW